MLRLRQPARSRQNTQVVWWIRNATAKPVWRNKQERRQVSQYPSNLGAHIPSVEMTSIISLRPHSKRHLSLPKMEGLSWLTRLSSSLWPDVGCTTTRNKTLQRPLFLPFPIWPLPSLSSCHQIVMQMQPAKWVYKDEGVPGTLCRHAWCDLVRFPNCQLVASGLGNLTRCDLFP